MPIRSDIAVVAILPRFIAASNPVKFVEFPCPYRRQRLHPVVDVDVVRCAAISAAQYAFAGHLLLVCRESAGQAVRLPG